MPKITDDGVCQAIAREYLSNGRRKVLALIAVGYKKSYASRGGKLGGLTLYDNLRVKDAIAAIEAENKEKDEITKKEIQELHRKGIALSLKKGDLVNFTRNIEGLGRTVMAYADKTVFEDGQKAKELAEKEQAEARRIASIRLSEAG